jgi:serine/threonine-protein kinase RsbW
MAALPTDLVRSMRVQAETSQLSSIRRFVDEVASELALEAERLFDLKVAVSEAGANAIEHAGNNSAVIEVSARLRDRRLTFVVSDTGFFRTPALPRSANQSRGLGLPLMVALMDEVHFARLPGGGTTVSLSITL